VRTSSDLVFTRFDEETAALLHLETKRYYTLNETGARIWELMEEGLAAAEVAEALHREFEVDPALAQQCVDGFVAELIREGLAEE